MLSECLEHFEVRNLNVWNPFRSKKRLWIPWNGIRIGWSDRPCLLDTRCRSNRIRASRWSISNRILTDASSSNLEVQSVTSCGNCGDHHCRQCQRIHRKIRLISWEQEPVCGLHLIGFHRRRRMLSEFETRTHLMIFNLYAVYPRCITLNTLNSLLFTGIDPINYPGIISKFGESFPLKISLADVQKMPGESWSNLNFRFWNCFTNSEIQRNSSESIWKSVKVSESQVKAKEICSKRNWWITKTWKISAISVFWLIKKWLMAICDHSRGLWPETSSQWLWPDSRWL